MLLGLALTLGGLAASDVSRREAALARRDGPSVPVVVTRGPVSAGDTLARADLAIRDVPARFAPAGAIESPAEAAGAKLVVNLPGGAYLTPGSLGSGGEPAAAGPKLRAGERAADLVAVAPADQVAPGSRVDVLVSREGDRGDPGHTVLALENVEVLASAPAVGSGGGSPDAAGATPDLPRTAVSLRVTLRQAVYLAAAQSFAREIRLLPRAPGDGRRGAAGLTVDASGA